MTKSDSNFEINLIGRFDDGSNDIFASPKLNEGELLKGIGNMNSIPAVSVSVELSRD